MTDKLFDEWQAYEKIVHNDYMGHRRFFARLGAEIDARLAAPPRILDLGCGDGSPMSPLLAARNVAGYVGVDESATALSIAGKRLHRLGVPWRLVRGDLLEVMETLDGPYDLIVASYALHHLASPSAKSAALQACRRLLSAAGFIAVIDVFRAGGESREDYLRRWIDDAGQRYTALDPSELSTVTTHVAAMDFPESAERYRLLGKAAGLGRFEFLGQDDSGLNGMLILAA